MPRHKRNRKMHMPPAMRGYKPYGIPGREIESVTLLLEEYEALKLADYENMSQEKAAEKMNVSRPTFTRVYDRARKKLAKAFVEGKAILIEGGYVEFSKTWYKCNDCHETFVAKKTSKKNCPVCNSLNIDPVHEYISLKEDLDSFCVCIECNIKVPHQTGLPCKETACPSCGKPMRRE